VRSDRLNFRTFLKQASSSRLTGIAVALSEKQQIIGFPLSDTSGCFFSEGF
jgi:hypothetical protein